MAKQNIFDNETFFEGYKAIRDREGNANDLFEIPALFSLLPDLKGKSVLDLGCGFVNTLTENGFIIEKMIEPIPTDEILERFPEQEDLFHKPDFLLVKAKK
jgi:hypothetical protein